MRKIFVLFILLLALTLISCDMEIKEQTSEVYINVKDAESKTIEVPETQTKATTYLLKTEALFVSPNIIGEMDFQSIPEKLTLTQGFWRFTIQGLNANGDLVSTGMIEKVIREGVNEITISLDSPMPEEYEYGYLDLELYSSVHMANENEHRQIVICSPAEFFYGYKQADPNSFYYNQYYITNFLFNSNTKEESNLDNLYFYCQEQIQLTKGKHLLFIYETDHPATTVFAVSTIEVEIFKDKTTKAVGYLYPLNEIDLNIEILYSEFNNEDLNNIKYHQNHITTEIEEDIIYLQSGDSISFSYTRKGQEQINSYYFLDGNIKYYISNTIQFTEPGFHTVDFVFSKSSNEKSTIVKKIKVYVADNFSWDFDAGEGEFSDGEKIKIGYSYFPPNPSKQGANFIRWQVRKKSTNEVICYIDPSSIDTTRPISQTFPNYRNNTSYKNCFYNNINDMVFTAYYESGGTTRVYIDGEYYSDWYNKCYIPSQYSVLYSQPNGQGEIYHNQDLIQDHEIKSDKLYLYSCKEYPKTTITYKLGDGYDDITEDRIIGTAYYKFPKVYKAGYEFIQWEENNKKVEESQLISKNDHTLTAVWKEIKEEGVQVTFLIDYYNIGSENNAFPPKTVIPGQPYGELPLEIGDPIPSLRSDGTLSWNWAYHLEGWYLDKYYMQPVTESTIVNSLIDHVLYAKWENFKSQNIEINFSWGYLCAIRDSGSYFYYSVGTTVDDVNVNIKDQTRYYPYSPNLTIRDIGGLPKVQEKEGYDFLGWIDTYYLQYLNMMLYNKENYLKLAIDNIDKYILTEDSIVVPQDVTDNPNNNNNRKRVSYYALYVQKPIQYAQVKIHIEDLINNYGFKMQEINCDALGNPIYKDGCYNGYLKVGEKYKKAFTFAPVFSTDPDNIYYKESIFTYYPSIKTTNNGIYAPYYKIIGYSTTPDLLNPITGDEICESLEEIHLYPIIRGTYSLTIKYYSDERKTTLLHEDIWYYGEDIEFYNEIPIYLPEGKEFKQWKRISSSSIWDQIIKDKKYLNDNNSTVEVYPQYSLRPIKLLFDLQGGYWDIALIQSVGIKQLESSIIYAGDKFSDRMQFGGTYPAKYGYTFLGWKVLNYVPKKTLNFSLTIGEGVSEIPYTEEITIYAIWEANNYKILFNGLTQTKQVTFGETYGSLPTPTKTGYKFLGWYFQGEKITSNTIVTQADEHQLEPRWEKLEINCTFQLESEVLETKTYSYNETFGALPTSTIDGKEIVWFLEGHPITPDMIVSDLRTEDFTLNGVIGNKVIKMSNKDVVRYMDDDAIIEAMSNIIDPNDKKFHICINNYLEISYFFPRLKASEQITYYSSNIAGTHVIEVNPRYFDYQIIYPYGNDYYANKDIIITLITENNKEFTFPYNKATESSIKTMQKDSKIEWLEDGQYYRSSIYASSIRKIIFEIPESPYYEGFYQPFEIKMNSNFSASYGYRPAGLYDSEFNNIEFTLREENEIGTIVIDNEERAIPFIQKAWASEPYLRTYAEIDNQDFATGKLTSGEQGSGVGYARIEAYGNEFEGRLYNCEWDENGIRGTISYPYYINKYTNEVFDKCSGYLDFDIAWDDESKYYETNHFDIKELEIRY